MDPIIGSALIGAGSSLLGGIVGANQDFKMQKKLMQYQNDLNIQNWNMQNEYNSPSAVMQRYKDAGLNPNLMYGGSGTAAGNVGSISTPNVDKYQRAAEQAIANASQALQLKLLNAQIQGQKAQNTKTAAETANLQMDNQLKEFDLNYKTETRPYSIDLMLSQIDNARSDLETKMLLRDKARQELTRGEYEIFNTWLSGAETMSRIANLEKDLQVKDSNIQLNNAKVREVVYICQNLAALTALNKTKNIGEILNNGVLANSYNFLIYQAKNAAMKGQLDNFINFMRSGFLSLYGTTEPGRLTGNGSFKFGPIQYSDSYRFFNKFNSSSFGKAFDEIFNNFK